MKRIWILLCAIVGAVIGAALFGFDSVPMAILGAVLGALLGGLFGRFVPLFSFLAELFD